MIQHFIPDHRHERSRERLAKQGGDGEGGVHGRHRPAPTPAPTHGEPRRTLREGRLGGKVRLFLAQREPLDSNTPHSMILEVADAPDGVRRWNERYWGIPATVGGEQRLPLHAPVTPGFKGPLLRYLESDRAALYRGNHTRGRRGDRETVHGHTSRFCATPPARFVIEARSTGTMYLQFYEDIGAEPMYIAFVGETCYFRCCQRVPMDRMGWVVEDSVIAVKMAPMARWIRNGASCGPRPDTRHRST